MTITLITGGARSGKSRHAEARALSLPGRPVYIATAEVMDTEMAARVAEHRARRGGCWAEYPAPLELAAALSATDGNGPRLVDCLTLWLSNLMHAGRNPAVSVKALLDALKLQRAPVVLVSNELGLGIVPDNALARGFRDAHGRMNQEIAAAADEVTFVVAGLPLKLKPKD